MKFIGVKYVEGYKDYNQPYKRVSSHPTLIFFDDNKKQYYFIHFTSVKKDSRIMDVARFNGQKFVFKATDVVKRRYIEKEHLMNMMIYIARCDETYVSTLEKGAFEGQIYINHDYVCSNLDEFISIAIKVIFKVMDEFFIYNGNDNDYECPDLENSSLSKELIQCMKQTLKLKNKSRN